MTPVQRASASAKAKLMHKQAVAAERMLRRAMDKVNESGPAPENELDLLIFNLMQGQSNSQDACPAKLLEAKHQLNSLHKHMYAVAYEINHTSLEVKHSTKYIETLELQWQTEQRECTEGKEKCKIEIESYKKQWEILKWELIEMKQIGNPGVTITASDMSYAAFKSREASEEETKWNRSQIWDESTEESSEDSGDTDVPEYDGLGEKPKWWPTLLQAQATPVDSAPPAGAMSATQAVSSIVKNAKSGAKDLEHCFNYWKQNGGGPTGGIAASLMGKNSDPLESSWGDADNGGIMKRDANGQPMTEVSEGSSNKLGGSGFRNRTKIEDNYSYDEKWTKSFSNTSSSTDVSESCKLQLIAFEETYYKAYRKLTRLISEYEILVNSTECEDAVDENCDEQDREYSTKTKKETEHLGELTEQFSHVKGHITVTSNQEKALTAHIQVLSTACKELDETVSDLDKVRDAIQVFGVCVGVGRPTFHVPIFGKFVQIEMGEPLLDEEIDFELNKACINSGIILEDHAPRAAETSEIMQQAIEGAPETNTAGSVLMGTCPHCAGNKDDPKNKRRPSGHYRTCWNSGVHLDGSTMRSNCGHRSIKSIMCVFDRYDLVTNSSITSSITSGSSSSSSSSSTNNNGDSSSSSSTSVAR